MCQRGFVGDVDAGVVDGVVDPAESRDSEGDEGGNLVLLGDVRHYREDFGGGWRVVASEGLG